jgi:RNA polymerase-interacting CarD/CdnL/TRCF family regulator
MMDQIGIIQASKLEKYLRLAYVMNYEVLGKMTEMEWLLPESVRRSIKLLIQDIGLREVIEQIGLDEVIKVIGRDEVIKAIGLNEMIKTVELDEVIKAIGLDKVEKALRKLKKRPK